ncbi:Adenosylcobinamide-GDP ribazoletransferase [anaerobic digester metagenome]|nr:adenosylcobinamide-GDP ribazoletransferase [Desulfovibrio desulfuricans]
MTRLVPPRPCCTADSLSAAMPFFAPVGLVLGALCTAAAFLCLWLFDAPDTGFAGRCLVAALAAWAWMLCEIWATRGLHWDGLSDLGDATSSGASGERFWAVLRDSRLGAFGALHLLVAFSGLWLALTWQLANGQWIAPLLAPAWGRAACIWLAAYTVPHDERSLGGLACAGSSPQLARWQVVLATGMLVLVLLLGNCPFWRLPLLAFGQFLLIHSLIDTTREHGGVSGDFLGACIQWSQLWFLLVTV